MFEHIDQTITHFRECHRDSNQFTTLQGGDLTIRHTSVTKTPQVGTVRDAIKETIWAHLTLVHNFTRYLNGHPWVARRLSQ
jgi:hypothetical protein